MKEETTKGVLRDLVEAVASGDTDALARLYRAMETSIHAFALSRLGDPERAATVLHEVMFEVWRQAARFEGRSRVSTWILGIAHHKILDAARRKRRWRPEPPPDEDVADVASPSPFDRLDGDERRAAVKRALDRLSNAHRQVVHLAFYEDLSYPEIARLLDIPEGTVKTRMFHARKALRHTLAGILEGATA